MKLQVAGSAPAKSHREARQVVPLGQSATPKARHSTWIELLGPRSLANRSGAILLAAACLWTAPARSQDRSGYIRGEQQGLEMLVHIIGEVQKPGEYRVADQTNLLELLSKAGGPTQFSKLSSVSVRRVPGAPAGAGGAPPRVEILRINMEDILSKQGMASPPMLQPGDVVYVPKNSWHTWKNVSGVIRDVSVVVSAYFLYSRASRN